MKNARFFFLLAVVGLLAACIKEQPATESFTTLKVGIAAEITPAVKTHMGPSDGSERLLYWSNGDRIAVNGNASEALEGLDETTKVASFHFGTPITGSAFSLLYPAGIYTDATHVTLPAVQTYKEGGFAQGMYPMAGYSTDGSSLSLNHLCAVVKVSVVRAPDAEADLHNLLSAGFKGKGGEQVSGVFGISYATPALSGTSASEADQLVSVSHLQSITSGHVATYYLVVPARTYSSGFDIVLQDVSGDKMTAAFPGSVSLAAGKLYNLTDIQFVPTELSPEGIAIGSVEQLIAFAQAYNNKEYEEMGSSLKATLTADLVFDASTSAAYNATGGIGLKNGVNGTEDYYFSGQFNGNGHSISDWEATVPLFVATGSAGKVKNLTLDASCSFTFTHANTQEANFGAVVGYHKGELKNVSVASDITLAAVANVGYLTALGGLVGRATTGTLTDCEYSGLIEVPAGFTVSDTNKGKKLIIGGLVGEFTNSGSVLDSAFKGAISTAAQITSTDKTNPYVLIGGVVGYMNSAESIVSSCEATADHAAVATAHSSLTAQIVQKATVSYHSAIGGIAGEINAGSVSACTNAASIGVSIYRGGDGTGRYIKTGGIVGKCNAGGTVTGCTNNGTVSHRSNPRIQDLGGIAGYNAGTVTACTNTAAVSHMTSGQSVKAGRVVSLGGVIGQNAAGSTVFDVHNTANLEISQMEDGTNSEEMIGGVIGLNYADINGGEQKNITNTGRVYHSPNFASQFLGYSLGGIVGKSAASVHNARNSAYVYFRWNSGTNPAKQVYLGGIVGQMTGDGSIVGCVNEGGAGNAGEVYLYVAKGSVDHQDNYAGGILGKSASSVSISDCTNSGFVHGGNETRVNGTPWYFGGIVAYLAGASEILDCTNTGAVTSIHENNTDTDKQTAYIGGIAGFVEGTDTAPIIIGGTGGCIANATLTATRGWTAGIAAYAKYVHMANCQVEQDINVACRGVGGLIGKASNCTIASSAFNAEKVHANNTQSSTGQGGLVGWMENSTVDGCYSYATILTNNTSIATVGAIVGNSSSGNTVQNCHYKSLVTTTAGEVEAQIAGLGSFTDGGGNEADL